MLDLLVQLTTCVCVVEEGRFAVNEFVYKKHGVRIQSCPSGDVLKPCSGQFAAGVCEGISSVFLD